MLIHIRSEQNCSCFSHYGYVHCEQTLTSSLGGFLVSLIEPSWKDGRNRRRLISSVRLPAQLKFDPVSQYTHKNRMLYVQYVLHYTTRQVHTMILSVPKDNGQRWLNFFSIFFLDNTKMTWLHVKDNLKRNYLSKANSWVWSIDTLKCFRVAWCCNFCWNNFCESIIRSREAWLQKSFAPTGNVSLIIFAEYSSNI